MTPLKYCGVRLGDVNSPALVLLGACRCLVLAAFEVHMNGGAL